MPPNNNVQRTVTSTRPFNTRPNVYSIQVNRTWNLRQVYREILKVWFIVYFALTLTSLLLLTTTSWPLLLLCWELPPWPLEFATKCIDISQPTKSPLPAPKRQDQSVHIYSSLAVQNCEITILAIITNSPKNEHLAFKRTFLSTFKYYGY